MIRNLKAHPELLFCRLAFQFFNRPVALLSPVIVNNEKTIPIGPSVFGFPFMQGNGFLQHGFEAPSSKRNAIEMNV